MVVLAEAVDQQSLPGSVYHSLISTFHTIVSSKNQQNQDLEASRTQRQGPQGCDVSQKYTRPQESCTAADEQRVEKEKSSVDKRNVRTKTE